MCGICGALTSDGTPLSTSYLSVLNDTMTHRGPDDFGTFASGFRTGNAIAGAVGLAMRRLAIIDVAHGHQPMESEKGEVVVVYNGEIYNADELRSELQAAGHTFRTHSDTEILVHGYEVWGDDLAARLNGMFAFAIWDKNRARLVLGRDRMGIKPLHYAAVGGRLLFGSEIKSILADPSVSREIDPYAVDDYFSLRYIPTPRTIYKEIRKLPPASLLIWESGRLTIRPYWNFSPVEGPDRGLDYYLEKTDALLEDAVRRQLVSDVPLGCFLSGGLDSPTIAYHAKRHKPDLVTFNIYFADRSFSEREAAALVARHLGTHHVEQEVHPHVEAILPALVDVFDEPFGDDSMVPTYFLTKMARERMKVALSGDGGDELFGGYPTYIADRLATLYRSIPHFVSDRMLQPAVNALPVSFNRWSWEYKAKAFMHVARRPSPLEHFGWTEIFRPESKAELYSAAFWDRVRSRPLAESFSSAFANSGGRRGFERFLYVDQKTHLLDEFLVKVDRLSMANSLEVRPPFLDHRLVELAAEIPMRYKVRGWTTKWIIRRLMKDRLPRSIVNGEKKGFAPPTASWLAGDLLPLVRRVFAPDRLRDIPFLNPEQPLKLLELHISRKANLARRIWTLLMFVSWYDRKILNRS